MARIRDLSRTKREVTSNMRARLETAEQARNKGLPCICGRQTIVIDTETQGSVVRRRRVCSQGHFLITREEYDPTAPYLPPLSKPKPKSAPPPMKHKVVQSKPQQPAKTQDQKPATTSKREDSMPVHPLTEQLKTAKGKEYYTLLKAILKDVGPQIVDDAKAIRRETGHFKIIDMGVLALKYNLNLKATVEWLEEQRFIVRGFYASKLANSNLKVRDILEAARKKMEQEGVHHAK